MKSALKTCSRRLAAVVLATGLLLCWSCATGPDLVACTGPVTVTTTSDLDPTFSWTPNCLVDQLSVEADIAPSAGGPQPRWLIAARVTGRGAGAPLRYGHVPFTMEEALSASPLVAGHEYTVRVFASGTQIGLRVFGP